MIDVAAIERRYRIVVTNHGSVVLDESQVRCRFRVSKSMLGTPHRAVITLQSLAPDDRNVDLNGAHVDLYAGDANGIGIIFSGEITDPSIEKSSDGFSRVLKIHASDGENFDCSSFISLSVAAGIRIRDLITLIATSSTIPLSVGYISPTLGQTRLTRGRVLFGKSSDELSRISRFLNAIMWVEQNTLFFVDPSDTHYSGQVTISPQSGMLDVPTKRDCYIEGAKWLDYCAYLNSEATIDNQRDSWQSRVMISGRVFSIIHSGDTHDGEWRTIARVMPPNMSLWR